MTEAERVVRQNAERICWKIIGEILESHELLVELAVTRANTIGFDEYGDASFRKSGKELQKDRFEEYADAYFYCGVELDGIGKQDAEACAIESLGIRE